MTEVTRNYIQSANEGGKVVSLTHRPPLPPGRYPWYSFVDCRSILWPEGLIQQYIPMTARGIKLATSQLVVQCLSHLRHLVTSLVQSTPLSWPDLNSHSLFQNSCFWLTCHSEPAKVFVSPAPPQTPQIFLFIISQFRNPVYRTVWTPKLADRLSVATWLRLDWISFYPEEGSEAVFLWNVGAPVHCAHCHDRDNCRTIFIVAKPSDITYKLESAHFPCVSTILCIFIHFLCTGFKWQVVKSMLLRISITACKCRHLPGILVSEFAGHSVQKSRLVPYGTGLGTGDGKRENMSDPG